MHWVIIAITGPLRGEEYLVQGTLEIGRSGDLAIQLIAPSVSRRHALIRLTEEDEVELVDLDSRNGTFVRGERLTRRLLEPGDTFEIGSSSFRVEHRVGDPDVTTDELQLNLLSGPAEDVTAIHHRGDGRFVPLPATARPTTLPRPEATLGACGDPLHEEATRRGWRYCPACGGDPRRSSDDEDAPVPSTEP